MVDFFQQVDEELREKRARELAIRAIPWVVGAVLLSLVGVGGYWGYQVWRDDQSTKASTAYDRGVKALESNNPTAAAVAFSETPKGATAYYTLSLMQQAGIAVRDNKIPEAVRLFDEAAKAAPSPVMADSASLRAAYLLMDTASYADIEKRLLPLAAEGRPYRALAREAIAMAKLQAGKIDEARGDFVALSLMIDAPDGLQARARAAIQSIDSGSAPRLAEIARDAARTPVLQTPVLPPVSPAGAPAPQAGAAAQ